MDGILINYDILFDDKDLALLFHVGVDLNDATLLMLAYGNLALQYPDGKRVAMAKCKPELWTRISQSNDVLCSRLSANKMIKPDNFIIPVINLI